ncbi:predicted protein [Uncinocarpus reesii 1704]|uniref:Uncharacterized protein n=1 Tax=Uncinocarpus reesii (strain UAMH 1704) TaxID=336963 RepID=C4K065_UNCRE|nr:uncharacterized protein UREG_07816 [Uncinocarpus reesii 1704]EEP82951.1 predicted protein [Uncinocarpus reesii 1704]
MQFLNILCLLLPASILAAVAEPSISPGFYRIIENYHSLSPIMNDTVSNIEFKRVSDAPYHRWYFGLAKPYNRAYMISHGGKYINVESKHSAVAFLSNTSWTFFQIYYYSKAIWVIEPLNQPAGQQLQLSVNTDPNNHQRSVLLLKEALYSAGFSFIAPQSD